MEELAEHAGVPVYNGLTNEWHPTQMLADFLTMHERSNKPYDALAYAFVGDGRCNMGRSLLITGAILGSDVRIDHPAGLGPPADVVELARELARRSRRAASPSAPTSARCRGADFVHTDVWVSMGEPKDVSHERGRAPRSYQVNSELLAATDNPKVKFMHCLPASTTSPPPPPDGSPGNPDHPRRNHSPVSEAMTDEGERGGVSTLELFFDLVFVFTITQLTSVIGHEPSFWRGLLQAGVLLGIIFWMYGGYAWLTNTVIVDRLARRFALLAGMAGFLVVALTVPTAFTGSGAAFGLAYLAVVLIHLAMFTLYSPLTVKQAIIGLAPFNVSTALLVVIGGIVGGDAQYALWISAFLIEWISPKLVDDSGFVIDAGHFVERHGLVLIVAIGESVIAVGIGAAGLAVDLQLVIAAVLGLALSACLWWSYFGVDPEGPEDAMEAAPAGERPRLAIDAFGYCFWLILLGVIVTASALEQLTAHPFDVMPDEKALALGAGIAIFLIGEALFRQVLGLPSVRSRAVAALLAMLTIPIGTEIGAVAQVGVLVVLMVAMLATEAKTGPSPLVRWLQ